MAVTARKQAMFWGIGFLLLALTLWALGSTLVPFMLGAAIAYLLDPLADRLERLGLGRVAATAIIALLVVLGFVLTMGPVVPALIDQGQQLVVLAGLVGLLAKESLLEVIAGIQVTHCGAV